MKKRPPPHRRRASYRPRQPPPTLAERLEARSRRNLGLVSLSIVVVVISGLLVVSNAAIGVSQWAERKFDWRDQEYEKLRGLRAGFTLRAFERALGAPVFDRTSPDGKYREATFQRREHWVQTVSRADGTVVLYSVTSCDAGFKPTFTLPRISADAPTPAVTLGESRIGSVLPDGANAGTQLILFGSGATANSRYYQVDGSGNPSNYKTHVWGVNDACSDWQEIGGQLWDAARLPPMTAPFYRGNTGRAPAWAHRIRHAALVNTYAETAPLFDLNTLRGPRENYVFQIGADRLLTRTTWGD